MKFIRGALFKSYIQIPEFKQILFSRIEPWKMKQCIWIQTRLRSRSSAEDKQHKDKQHYMWLQFHAKELFSTEECNYVRLLWNITENTLNLHTNGWNINPFLVCIINLSLQLCVSCLTAKHNAWKNVKESMHCKKIMLKQACLLEHSLPLPDVQPYKEEWQ